MTEAGPAGVVALRLSLAEIGQAMARRSGMGIHGREGLCSSGRTA